MSIIAQLRIQVVTSLATCILLTACEAPQPSKHQSSSFTNAEWLIDRAPATTEQELRSRILETFVSFWPSIATEHQHERLPALLIDPLPEIRKFGVERVAVFLRDGQATERELQLVVDKLKDPSASVRLASAKLLPEIDVAGLEEFVVSALATESNIRVASEELVFFQTRPHSSAFNVVVDRIQQGPIEPAAKSLVSLLDTMAVSESRAMQIVKIVKRVRKHYPVPELITIEAMLGCDKDKNRLIPLLHSSNTASRLAVAKGFAAAGYAAPLIKIADQPQMYEYALEALRNQESIEAFVELIALHQENNTQWNIAAIAISSSLDTSSLLRADDMLDRLGEDQLRLTILKSIWENVGHRSRAAQKAIARRAVPLMIDQDDAVGALQLLDAFGESLVDEDLLNLRFQAAISASAWDAAADTQSSPEPWIDAWIAVQEEDPNAATVIRQQIQQRFGEQLTTSQRETLGIHSPNIEDKLQTS